MSGQSIQSSGLEVAGSQAGAPVVETTAGSKATTALADQVDSTLVSSLGYTLPGVSDLVKSDPASAQLFLDMMSGKKSFPTAEDMRKAGLSEEVIQSLQNMLTPKQGFSGRLFFSNSYGDTLMTVVSLSVSLLRKYDFHLSQLVNENYKLALSVADFNKKAGITEAIGSIVAGGLVLSMAPLSALATAKQIKADKAWYADPKNPRITNRPKEWADYWAEYLSPMTSQSVGQLATGGANLAATGHKHNSEVTSAWKEAIEKTYQSINSNRESLAQLLAGASRA